MQLSHYVTPHSIIVPLKGKTKEDVLAELVRALAEQNGLEGRTSELQNEIEQREALASTFLPMGIALPHARIPGIDDILMIMGISPQGIVDEHAIMPMTAKVFFLFFSPTHEKEFGKHLKLLAQISGIFSDTDLAGELSRMTDRDEIFSRIQQREREIEQR